MAMGTIRLRHGRTGPRSERIGLLIRMHREAGEIKTERRWPHRRRHAAAVIVATVAGILGQPIHPT